jgi:HTH-type transcriptional regulator/antitoxin HipB
MAIDLRDQLRQARKDRGLSQEDLAAKLAVRQSQISDLERSAIDPRLSTVRDVARALDLELMLIPRTLIPVVEGLSRGVGGSAARPLYTLDQPDAPGEGDLDRVTTPAGVARSQKRQRRAAPGAVHASRTTRRRKPKTRSRAR